jgi:DNA processing protein
VTSPTEHAALIFLLRHGTRPQQQYAELVEEAGSALSVLEHEHVGQASLFDAEPRAELDTIRVEIARWKSQGMRVLTVLDPAYPDNLRAAHDRPPLIFIEGLLTAGDARSVAVVGSRKPSEHGLKLARAIAGQLVERGYSVVSGLATGIDTAAHRAALARDGRTIAVIGTGLRRFYPPENAELQRQIASEYAVISQFWPETPASRQSFPMRNAVMSGLTLATVVVEASHTSGARIQARLALAHGRPVLLADALLDQEWARELAQRPGTHVVGSPEDVTDVVERMTGADTLTA